MPPPRRPAFITHDRPTRIRGYDLAYLAGDTSNSEEFSRNTQRRPFHALITMLGEYRHGGLDERGAALATS